MSKVKKRYYKKNVRQAKRVTMFLVILVIALGYYIMTNGLLKTNVSELTTNYISFNNANSTDMLKVANIEKMSNNIGESTKNKSFAQFEINGSKDDNYEIVLYHIGNVIPEEYVYYALFKDDKIIEENTLNNMPNTFDGGRVIYSGIVDNDQTFVVKMWVSKKYLSNPKNVSYEIKIKAR